MWTVVCNTQSQNASYVKFQWNVLLVKYFTKTNKTNLNVFYMVGNLTRMTLREGGDDHCAHVAVTASWL